MADFVEIIRDLMEEHETSERRLAMLSGVNRGTFRRVFTREASNFPLRHFEKILALYGYDLDVVKIGEPCEEIEIARREAEARRVRAAQHKKAAIQQRRIKGLLPPRTRRKKLIRIVDGRAVSRQKSEG